MGTLQFLLFSVFSFSLCFLISGVHGGNHRHLLANCKPSKLFVFGDSYADTGNIPKSLSTSWKEPYGITFPGKPAGRFSSGRILTDYLSGFVGVKSPIPYQWRKYGPKNLKYGMNFAYGGTGVFNTSSTLLPNMTAQIGLFQELIKEKVYTTVDLQSSLALVSNAGNDYSYYITLHNGSIEGLSSYIPQVVNQLATNLKRINGLGVKKVVVYALQPLGCLPSSTWASSFQQCNETKNQLVNLHNSLLQQAVAKLNNETKHSPFAILDLYSAFTTIFKNKGDHPGSSTFRNPLEPCCMGKSTQYTCGEVANGTKMYTVCDNPETTFFWDYVHPTQAGWRSVYLALQANLKQL